MINVRPYRFEDVLKIEPKEEGVKNQKDYEKWAKMNELGPGYTILFNDEVIACAGIRIFWEGVGEVWAVISNDSSKHLRLILEEFGKRLEFTIRELKMRWLQVSLSKNNKKGIHFAQHYGFKRKCEMKYYLPDGSDAILYAREIEQ